MPWFHPTCAGTEESNCRQRSTPAVGQPKTTKDRPHSQPWHIYAMHGHRVCLRMRCTPNQQFELLSTMGFSGTLFFTNPQMIYIYIYIYIYVCVYVYIYIYIHIHIHIHLHIHLHLHIYIYICLYVCIYMFVCMYINIYTYIYTYIYIYIYMYIYIRILYIYIYIYADPGCARGSV